MPALGIEQAARASGRTARDIREMIEEGVLPATRPAGRWLVSRDDLGRAESWRSGGRGEGFPENRKPGHSVFGESLSPLEAAGEPGEGQPEAAESLSFDAPAAPPPAQHARPIGADPVARVIEFAARPEPEAEVAEPAPAPAAEPAPGPAAEPAASAPEPPTSPDGVAELASRLEAAAVQIADLRTERDSLKTQLREQVASLKHSLEETLSELDAARARAAEAEAARYEESVRREGSPTRAALTPLFRSTTGDDSPGSPGA